MYVKGFVLNTVEQVFPTSQAGSIPQEWIDAVGWREIDQTESESIGLASKNDLKGDLVCILYGCSVPVILRRCQSKKTLQELAEEREEDFVNIVKEIQRRWKRKFERNNRAKESMRARLWVELMRRKKSKKREKPDPIIDFYMARKYGIRWKRIAKMGRLQRE
jgi:hypothetical protein